MRTKLLIASTSDPDMWYVLGVPVSDPVALIDTGRTRYVLASALELPRLRRLRGITAVPLRTVLGPDGSLAGAALRFLAQRGIRSVRMSPTSPVRIVEHIRRRLHVHIGELYPERRCKTRRERRLISAVRDATVAALSTCLRLIKQSTVKRGALFVDGQALTAERLRLEARRVLLAYACSAPELIISHGLQTASPHEHGAGVLRAGEPIMLDFFPRSMETGYWFDMTRTVCKGPAPPSLRKLWRTVLAAQAAALATVQAGVPVRRVHEAAEQVFLEAGYETSASEGFIHGTGHGVGLEIHEAPRIGQVKGRLAAGDVITIEPGLYYRRVGGVRIEDTIVVTKQGYTDLTNYPKVLHI
ncbi:M24 family metallopeptidase [Candidatus Woesearchaeota archaeon]|nr:MAG: M24 family metallopeptidase [Candidatus Woesearchaeota archaeon]